ncbi:MAG: hypothetical protein ACOVSW_09180 [Candidatus Kapaibacteriota bacterium]|jgi:hypothetical protein
MSHAHAEHAEELHPNPLVTTIGVVAALAAGWLLGMLIPSLFHAPRFAAGIAMALIGIGTGAFSNSSSAFPGLQRFMETFGFSLFAFGLVRYFHFADILSKSEGFIGSLGKVLMMFM